LYVGDGVVGINTEAPTEALEVVGNGKISGDVTIGGTTTFVGDLQGGGVSRLLNFILDGGTF
jgi:hypothetical protein